MIVAVAGAYFAPATVAPDREPSGAGSFGCANHKPPARAAKAIESRRPEMPPANKVDAALRAEVASLPKHLKSGIRCPDGSYLPLLNGVPYAPPLLRDGAMPKVVAKVVDHAGCEWWKHADGSLTTTRWVDAQIGMEKRRIVVTDHARPRHEDLRPSRSRQP